MEANINIFHAYCPGYIKDGMYTRQFSWSGGLEAAIRDYCENSGIKIDSKGIIHTIYAKFDIKNIIDYFSKGEDCDIEFAGGRMAVNKLHVEIQ